MLGHGHSDLWAMTTSGTSPKWLSDVARDRDRVTVDAIHFPWSEVSVDSATRALQR